VRKRSTRRPPICAASSRISSRTAPPLPLLSGMGPASDAKVSLRTSATIGSRTALKGADTTVVMARARRVRTSAQGHWVGRR
jgi:hypothetical protein